jgi:hypothetical protein
MTNAKKMLPEIISSEEKLNAGDEILEISGAYA